MAYCDSIVPGCRREHELLIADVEVCFHVWFQEEDGNLSEPLTLNLRDNILTKEKRYTSESAALKMNNIVLEYTHLQTSTYFFLKQVHLNTLQTAINIGEMIIK